MQKCGRGGDGRRRGKRLAQQIKVRSERTVLSSPCRLHPLAYVPHGRMHKVCVWSRSGVGGGSLREGAAARPYHTRPVPQLLHPFFFSSQKQQQQRWLASWPSTLGREMESPKPCRRLGTSSSVPWRLITLLRSSQPTAAVSSKRAPHAHTHARRSCRQTRGRARQAGRQRAARVVGRPA
jgi:hypothetical protein